MRLEPNREKYRRISQPGQVRGRIYRVEDETSNRKGPMLLKPVSCSLVLNRNPDATGFSLQTISPAVFASKTDCPRSSLSFPTNRGDLPMRIAALALAWCAALASFSSANAYTQLFRETSHDFGTVARAAKTEYRFQFDNPYNQPIHVRSVRTSCGCTTPIIETETVPPGGRGSILARFNTGTHSGARAATVTVTFDKPTYTEVQLQVKGYIRTDVVFQPGEVNFGSVAQGESKVLDVVLDYVGKPTWEITQIRCDESCIQIEKEERSRSNGRIQYAMKIRLTESAPTGPIESEIVIHSNDRNLTTVPLRLTANIMSEISAHPNLLSLGDISVGESIKQVLVLKAQQPFRVLSIKSDEFKIQHGPLADDPKALHTLPIQLESSGDGVSGEAKGKIFVETDFRSKPSLSIDVVYRLKTPTSSSPVPFNPLRNLANDRSDTEGVPAVDVESEVSYR
jgi:hypothetical protein